MHVLLVEWESINSQQHNVLHKLTQSFAPQNNFLLFEVASIFLVHQDKIQIISYTESIVDGCISGGQVGRNACEVQSHGNDILGKGTPIHDFCDATPRERERERKRDSERQNKIKTICHPDCVADTTSFLILALNGHR